MSSHDPIPVRNRIYGHLEELTPAERRVAHAILGNYPMLPLRSAAVMAAESETSPATVVRFATKIGFDGLPDFRAAVRSELEGSTQSPFALYQAPAEGVSASVAAAKSVLSLITDAMQRLKPEQIDEAATLILGAKRVWVAGGRFSHGVAHTLFAHLNLFRPGVRLLAPWPAPVADQIAHAGRDELAIVFDFRRYDPTAEFITAHFAGSRGRSIVVTDPYLSRAAQYAALTFVVPIEGFGLVDSYAGALAVIDVLVANLVAKNERLITQRSAAIERSREHAMSVMEEALDRTDHVLP